MSRNMNISELSKHFEQIFAFDVETTGLDKENDEIIELSLADLEVIDNSFVIKQIEDNYILLNAKSVPDFITNLTGITNEHLNKHGVSRRVMSERVEALFNERKTLLIAHNANFDYNFLLSMLDKEKCNVDVTNVSILDTLTIYKDRRSYPHKLSDAIVAYNLTQQAVNSHRALDDVKATVLVLNAMYKEFEDISHYINLIGVNPKYGIAPSDRIPTLTYREQPYNAVRRLYDSI